MEGNYVLYIDMQRVQRSNIILRKTSLVSLVSQDSVHSPEKEERTGSEAAVRESRGRYFYL